MPFKKRVLYGLWYFGVSVQLALGREIKSIFRCYRIDILKCILEIAFSRGFSQSEWPYVFAPGVGLRQGLNATETVYQNQIPTLFNKHKIIHKQLNFVE